MTLNLPWTPTFELLDDVWTFTYPMLRWQPGARTEGRVLKTVTGVQGVSLRERKYLLHLVLRATEAELDLLFDFVTKAQVSSEPFTWVLNSQDPDVVESVEAWWESPRVNEAIKPVRDGSYQTLFTLPIVISRMSAPWDTEYFRLPVG